MSTRRSKISHLQQLMQHASNDMNGQVFESPYIFGDFVLIALAKPNPNEQNPNGDETSNQDNGMDVDDSPQEFYYFMARIDCVRLNRCPHQDQPLYPTNAGEYVTADNEPMTECDIMWPIYFYHDQSLHWIQMDQIRYCFGLDELENIQVAYDNPRFKTLVPQSEKVKDDPFFKIGFELMHKNCHAGFQFNYNKGGREDYMKWIEGDNKVPMLNTWESKGKAKNIIELNRLGSNLVVDDPNAHNDPIQQFQSRSLFKLKDIQVGDFIGAAYGAKYIGRVTQRDDEKIEVQFYRLMPNAWKDEPNPAKKRRKSTNSIGKSIQPKYKPKAKDSDWITEKRQGYIFAHFRKDLVVCDDKMNILNFVGLADAQGTLSQLEDDWDRWSASMHVKADGSSSEADPPTSKMNRLLRNVKLRGAN